MSQPALKCENNAILGKSTGTLTLFIAFKMAHSLLFQLRGNLYFLDFLQKSVEIIHIFRVLVFT